MNPILNDAGLLASGALLAVVLALPVLAIWALVRHIRRHP